MTNCEDSLHITVDRHIHNTDGTVYAVHPAHYLYALYNVAKKRGPQQQQKVKHEHTCCSYTLAVAW